MAEVQHSTLPFADQHEPKGATSAQAGQIYIRTGLEEAEFKLCSCVQAAPAGVSAPTTDVVIAPTDFTTIDIDAEATHALGIWTVTDGPTITYLDNKSGYCVVSFSVVMEHDDATPRGLSVVLNKNDVAVVGSESTRKMGQSAAATMSGSIVVALAPNDVFTLAVKVAQGDITVHNAFMSIVTFPPTD